jgi:hypothetical protein
MCRDGQNVAGIGSVPGKAVTDITLQTIHGSLKPVWVGVD